MNSANIKQTWFKACSAHDVPENGGACVMYKSHQIALFNFTNRSEWFATQNRCPHRNQMAISRGLLGSQGEEPKIACPFHKTTFSLVDGRCLNREEEYALATYPVAVVDGEVYIDLSSIENQAKPSNTNCVYEQTNS